MTTAQIIFTVVVSYLFIGCAILGLIIESEPEYKDHGVTVALWPLFIMCLLAVILMVFEDMVIKTYKVLAEK